MGKKIKVVLDTNVWISILMKKTLGREFSRIFKGKEVEVYVSKPILKEISKVLLYPKIKVLFKQCGIGISEVIRLIIENSTIVKPKHRINVIKEDPEDNRIIECAVEANASFIISGDKHLLKLRKYKNIKIISPRKFLEKFKS